MTVGGVSVTGQYLAAVTEESDEFQKDPSDGLLGLAFPAISNLKHDPFFFTAVSQKTAKEGAFAFKLAGSGSELYIGGTNDAHYSGAIEYHSVVGKTGFWQLGSAHVSANSTVAVSNIKTIIDSGTTLAYGPPADVKKLYATIDGSGVYDSDQGLYYVPCASLPTIAFSWGGQDWDISSAK